MVSLFLSFIAGLFTIILMDSIWLGIVVKWVIIREFGSLIELLPNGSIKFSIPVGLAAWAIIVIWVMIFASTKATSYQTALLNWALFWWVSYAIYDLTNLTFIKWYSSFFTAIDIAWGIVLCAGVSVVCYSVWKLF